MDNFHNKENICRICLAEDNNEIQCVFDVIDSTEGSMKFSEMLMACAKVEIISGDELSDQICSTCAQNTIKLYLFKTKCEESDRALRTRRLEEHSSIVIDKIEIDEEDMLDKLKSEIKAENNDDILNDNNNPLETIVYEDYNATCTDREIKLIVEKPKCEEHKSEEKYTGSSVLSYRLLNANGKRIHQCAFCDQVFSSVTAYKSHKSTHTLETSLFKCNLCEKTFHQTGGLNYHKLTHTGERPFQCDICNKRFKALSQLKEHTFLHTGEKQKPHKCDVCDKRFAYLNMLTIHKRTHTGERPYECDICEKKFGQRCTLVAHKRIHTGEKPYECNVCKRKFNQYSSLTLHKRTHTGEKPYKCDVCEKTFTQANTLTLHKRSRACK